MARQKSPLSFLELPFDIHFEVARNLDYHSALMLARTNRYFHANMDPRTCLPKAEQRRFMMLVDTYMHNVNLWACHKCYRMLPIHAFSNRMRTFKKGKHGARLTRDGTRACVECSIQHRLFAHLVPIKKGDLLYYFCRKCGRFETASNKCQVIKVGKAIGRGSRKGIEMVTICWDGKDRLHEPKKFAPIEVLPESVMKRIVSHLDYRHAIRLGKTSHHMLEVVNPAALVPLRKRFTYVRTKWRHDFGQVQRRDVGQYEALACYACFRIRPVNKFSAKQIGLSNSYPDTYWKRRCGACVERMYRTPDNAELRSFRNRRECRFCKMLRDKNEPCGGCLDRLAIGVIDSIPEEEVLEVDYQDNLNGIEDLFYQEEPEETHTIAADGVAADKHFSGNKYGMPEKFHHRFRQGNMTRAEKSLYERVEAQARWSRTSRFSSVIALFRRLVHRQATEAGR